MDFVKKLLKFLLITGVVLAIIFTLVFYLTSDVAQIGDDFFAAAGRKDATAAYSFTSSLFKAKTPPDRFEAFLQANSFTETKSVSWSNRSIKNDTGQLKGTVTTQRGVVTPLTLDLIREEGNWRISAIELDRAGIVQ